MFDNMTIEVSTKNMTMEHASNNPNCQTWPSFQRGSEDWVPCKSLAASFSGSPYAVGLTRYATSAINRIGPAQITKAVRQSPPASGNTSGKVSPAPENSPTIIPFI